MKKPRASPPMTTSGRRSSAQSPRRSIVSLSASGSASSGMMSLKTMPFSGQSGTSRILAFRPSTSIAAIKGRQGAEALARREAARALARARRGSGDPRARPGGGLCCSSATTDLRAARGARPRGRPRCGTPAGCAARSRRTRGAHRQRRSRRHPPHTASLPHFRAARRARIPRAPGGAAASRRSAPRARAGRAPPPARRALLRVVSGASSSPPARPAPGGSPAAAGTRRAGGGGSCAAGRDRPRRRAGSPPASASARAGPDLRGSGSSRSRRPGTRPAGAGRRPRCAGGRRVRVLAPPSPLREEGQLVLPDLKLVTVFERRRLDAAPVEERPIQAALILDEELAVAAKDDGVPSRDGHVVQEDVAIRRAPDTGALLLEHEMLTRAPSPGANDEGGPLRLDLVENGGGLVLPLFRRIAHRRVCAGLLLREERAALRAVVHGLRVLEPALGAVDVAHTKSSRDASGIRAGTTQAGLRPNRTRSVWPKRLSPPAATPCPRGCARDLRRRPVRARSSLRTSVAALRALRAECRSCRAGAGACRRSLAPPR